MCLPYGNLITKILEHKEFNFESEKFEKNVTKIWEEALTAMRYVSLMEMKLKNPPKKEEKDRKLKKHV